MTVLAKYQRLEAEGLWRPDPAAQRRDVIVSIGDATLTIATGNGSVLSHVVQNRAIPTAVRIWTTAMILAPVAGIAAAVGKFVKLTRSSE